MPVNIEVKPRQNKSPERMIKRFNNKVKKSGILEEVRERRYYEKPSKLKRLKKQRAKRLARKAQQQYEERFND